MVALGSRRGLGTRFALAAAAGIAVVALSLGLAEGAVAPKQREIAPLEPPTLVAPTRIAVSNADWAEVAVEHSSFTLTEAGEVRYGKGDNWTTKILGPGTYSCDNSVFGDPYPGIAKVCEARGASGSRRLELDPGRDYIVLMPSEPLKGGLTIVGGRNIEIVGGEIVDETPISPSASVSSAYGLYLENQTGTVHLEGLWIHGRGIGQALVLAEWAGATVQVQSSRFAALHPVGHVHTDGIQSWAGPTRLRLRDVTIRTAGVGIQTQPNQFQPVSIDWWEYRRVNIVQMTKAAYALWKSAGKGTWWREIHEDLWVRNLGNYAWPSAREWNPGGNARIEGQSIKRGLPPGGDFVQARRVGIGYERP
jgi:hypothetical protein